MATRRRRCSLKASPLKTQLRLAYKVIWWLLGRTRREIPNWKKMVLNPKLCKYNKKGTLLRWKKNTASKLIWTLSFKILLRKPRSICRRQSGPRISVRSKNSSKSWKQAETPSQTKKTSRWTHRIRKCLDHTDVYRGSCIKWCPNRFSMLISTANPSIKTTSPIRLKSTTNICKAANQNIFQTN